MTATLADLRLRRRQPTPARYLPTPIDDFFKARLDHAAAGLAQPFKGITTDGRIVPGLFPIQATGVPTTPIREAAEVFLAALDPLQQAAATFPVDAEEWRHWSNIHPFLMRHGVCLDDLTPSQRDRALALLATGLSVGGFETARDVMRLNHTIGELTGKLGPEYGEWLYWLSIMGVPSADEPWGWQFDGHHLIVNCFVLGDQVVLTPLFMGSEPVYAEAGTYAGTRVFATEESRGLALMQSLTAEQRRQATIGTQLPVELFTAAFRDNFESRYEGVTFGDLSGDQQTRLLELVETYVGHIRPGHAEVRLEEVKRHLSEMHFAWMGGCDDDSVFYYRIHSPVILIEFDHQRGIAFANDEPTRHHIHTVVRTPNGNDYGKDLLRQHHERFDHSHVTGAAHH